MVVAGDHGEAFGEHGEITHSLFVYDTTLRTPLIVRGPGVQAGRVVEEAVGLVDVAATALARAALFEGEHALSRFIVRIFQPVRPMLADSAEDVGAALERLVEVLQMP